MFFALLLDYCVFVGLLNRLAIQWLHLDLGILHFFPALWMNTLVKSCLASVAVVAMRKISHFHTHRQTSVRVLAHLLSTSTAMHTLSDGSFHWQPH